jgi:class 3 adenylate cyclase
VTFLFTDIEGSTRILTLMGEGYAELLARHAEIMRSAIVDHSGTEVDTEGDSFFAAFSSATDGLAAAAEAQRALAAARWPEGAAILVRMGLHTGEGRLGGDSYVGIDVHRAARIAAAGHGGQVLLSDTTRALVEGTLPVGGRLRDLGEHRLKDFDRPMRISELEIDGLPTDFPELKTLDARPGNLPDQLTSFVGRDLELGQVTALIGAHRLVTLTGPGGTGKTRLALRAAGDRIGHHRDGAYFVDLAPIRNPDLVPSAIAQALRIGVDPGSDALSAARAHLRDRDLMLILDNFEHVRARAGTVEELLSAAPQVRVLVTSRMPLAIYGEQEYEVPPFEIPAALPAAELSGFGAVDLFVERARAVKPAFELRDDNAAAVAGIISHLDGLPLAIELAAGQLRILSPSAILLRLEQHLPLPSAAVQGVPSDSEPSMPPSTGATISSTSQSVVFSPDSRRFPAASRSRLRSGWPSRVISGFPCSTALLVSSVRASSGSRRWGRARRDSSCWRRSWSTPASGSAMTSTPMPPAGDSPSSTWPSPRRRGRI